MNKYSNVPTMELCKDTLRESQNIDKLTTNLWKTLIGTLASIYGTGFAFAGSFIYSHDLPMAILIGSITFIFCSPFMAAWTNAVHENRKFAADMDLRAKEIRSRR